MSLDDDLDIDTVLEEGGKSKVKFTPSKRVLGLIWGLAVFFIISFLSVSLIAVAVWVSSWANGAAGIGAFIFMVVGLVAGIITTAEIWDLW